MPRIPFQLLFQRCHSSVNHSLFHHSSPLLLNYSSSTAIVSGSSQLKELKTNKLLLTQSSTERSPHFLAPPYKRSFLSYLEFVSCHHLLFTQEGKYRTKRCININIRIEQRGTSLVVQWLRLQAANARRASSIPGWGTKIPQATWAK